MWPCSCTFTDKTTVGQCYCISRYIPTKSDTNKHIHVLTYTNRWWWGEWDCTRGKEVKESNTNLCLKPLLKRILSKWISASFSSHEQRWVLTSYIYTFHLWMSRLWLKNLVDSIKWLLNGIVLILQQHSMSRYSSFNVMVPCLKARFLILPQTCNLTLQFEYKSWTAPGKYSRSEPWSYRFVVSSDVEALTRSGRVLGLKTTAFDRSNPWPGMVLWNSSTWQSPLVHSFKSLNIYLWVIKW